MYVAYRIIMSFSNYLSDIDNIVTLFFLFRVKSNEDQKSILQRL